VKSAYVGALAIGLLACSSSSGGDGGTAGATTEGSGGSTGTTSPGTGGATGAGGGTGGGTGGAAADTWASYAQGFFATYCVECHSATVNPSLNFTEYAVVKANSATIRCGAAATMQTGCGVSPMPKQFPIPDATMSNPIPTDAERDRLIAWIEAGLPQ
jgi:hypothetical protein